MGWHGYVNSWEVIRDVVGELGKLGMVPPMPVGVGEGEGGMVRKESK